MCGEDSEDDDGNMVQCKELCHAACSKAHVQQEHELVGSVMREQRAPAADPEGGDRWYLSERRWV